MKHLSLILITSLFISVTYAQELEGAWYGNLKVSGMELPLVFHITENDAAYTATMDSPSQGGFNLPVDRTTFDNSILRLTIETSGITYEGTYNKDENTIKGIFKQRGMSLPLELSKNKPPQEKSEPPKRPQEPKPPYPYHSEEVTFKNTRDTITLSGTLTIPEKEGNFPAVVLISGSGPQNRDSEIFGHKPFLVIADHLTRNGIAVLRFDDRGVGNSEGDLSKATSKDLSTDVQAAITYLLSRKEVDKNRIGLLGHSEGGMIAPMIAKDSKEVHYLILLAGQGLPGDKLLLLQKKLLEQKSGIDEFSVAQGQRIFGGAYNIIKETPDALLLESLQNYFKTQFGNALNESQLNNLIQQLTTPWMKYFLKHDPSEDLEKITIPVLALFGENDFQVPPEENSKIIKEALQKAGNTNVKILTLESLNHLFQKSSTGLINEYSQIEQTISPEVLEIISEWILEKS